MIDPAFENILRKIAAEKSEIFFFETKRFKSILLDYAKNEFKEECSLLLKIHEADCIKYIDNAENVTECKQILVKRLEDEHRLAPSASAEMLDVLFVALWGERVLNQQSLVIEDLESKNSKLRNSIAKLEKELKKKSELNSVLEKELKKESKLNSIVVDLNRQNSELRNSITKLEKELKQENKNNSVLEKDNDELKRRNSDLDHSIWELKRECGEHKEREERKKGYLIATCFLLSSALGGLLYGFFIFTIKSSLISLIGVHWFATVVLLGLIAISIMVFWGIKYMYDEFNYKLIDKLYDLLDDNFYLWFISFALSLLGMYCIV